MNEATRVSELRLTVKQADWLREEIAENACFTVGISVTGLDDLNILLDLVNNYHILKIEYRGHRIEMESAGECV
jgi:hypothetical protein